MPILKNKFVFIPLILVLAIILSVSAYYALKNDNLAEKGNGGNISKQSGQANSGLWKFNLVKPWVFFDVLYSRHQAVNIGCFEIIKC